ncbi:MAG TPA: Uma2 family endonuclease [Silvibacterium sp.]|jgi:Uma2 family endonuclease|nr:Uma2 family endonuclease [Silvibacterium sp.]
MATSPQTVSQLEVYLHTAYRPDCDYVDGEIQERNVGEGEHSFVQAFLVALIWQHRREWKVVVYPEQRLQVSPTRYRIPDLCVVPESAPFESILTHPPLLCVEILSSEDRWSRMTERLADYRQMGVPNLWAIDPLAQKAWVWSQGEPLSDWREATILEVAGAPVRVDVTAIFAELAERKKAK